MAVNARKRRVLLIEPDPQFNAVLKDFLEAQRFDVETAIYGDDGLNKFETFSPDVVLLSRELPMEDGITGPDGLRVLKTIKQERANKNIPIIMASDVASEEDFDRYRKLKFSADDYIAKPFADTEILRRLENLVGFDLSEGVGDIKQKIDDAMDDSLNSLFDAAPEELGNVSSATRKEVTRLLEQVGQELDRQEDTYESEEMPLFDEEEQEEETEKEESEDVKKLRKEIQVLTRQLDKAQRQLVSERKRSRDIKKEWRSRLQDIEKTLADTEAREERMRDEFERMRQRFADIELDHTMEIDRIQGEKRRLEEEVMILREQCGDDSAYPINEVAEDLTKVSKALNKIVKKLTPEK